MAARGVATSRPASTSPAVTSHRRAAMARARAAAATRSTPSAWRRCAGAGATRMHRSPPRWSAPGRSRTATTSRRGGVATDTGPGPALYDTGPSAGDFAATRASADPDLADSDVFPRVRADIPETEAKTEVKGRPKNAAKGRGRPSRGRHDDDDDDWPSTEWDKLSDEQYWAELSADSPLATTARAAHPSTPAPAPKPAPPAKPARRDAQPPASSRPASRPQPALDGRRARPAPARRPSRPDGWPPGRTPAAARRRHRPGPDRPGPPWPRRPAWGRGGHGTAAGQEPPRGCGRPFAAQPRTVHARGPRSRPAGPGWPGPGRRTAARPGPGLPAPGLPPPGLPPPGQPTPRR